MSKGTAERSLLDRLLPGLGHLRRYERGWLRPDVLAGLTVAAYLVPQVMAYAEIAGLEPVAGLWARGANNELYGGWPGRKTGLETCELLTTPGSLMYG